MMRKLIYFLLILLLTTCTVFSYFQYKNSFTGKVSCNNIISNMKTINSTNRGNTYISLMYTNKFNEDYVANYGIYNVYSNEFENIYSHKKHDYSDFAIDIKNNDL